MRFVFWKASLRKEALKTTEPSKLAVAQTIEASSRCFKSINKELLMLIQRLLQCKSHTTVQY